MKIKIEILGSQINEHNVKINFKRLILIYRVATIRVKRQRIGGVVRILRDADIWRSGGSRRTPPTPPIRTPWTHATRTHPPYATYAPPTPSTPSTPPYEPYVCPRSTTAISRHVEEQRWPAAS